MFVDLDWPTNALSPLSASAELLVTRATRSARYMLRRRGWLSVTAGILSKRLNLSQNFFDHLVAPSFQLFPPLAPIPNSKGIPSAGALNTRGLEKLIFDGNRSLSWKRNEIGRWLLWNFNRKSRIEWYNFRWHWATPNPGFKVTVYLQVNYLKNGAF